MPLPVEKVLRPELPEAGDAAPFPPCPVDRLPRRRRNKLCIAVIALGAVNFLLYTVLYAALGGDAHNGDRRVIRAHDGSARTTYVVSGHYLRTLAGQEREVSRGLWIYSYVHSISVLLTSGAMIVSMLVLARPHILATMRGGFISGQAFVVAFATIVILLTAWGTILFTWAFVQQLAEQ